MPYFRYLAFDIFGGVFWVGTMILGSYYLGHLVPNIGQRIHYVIAVVIFLSILPAIISILRARRQINVFQTNRSASLPGAEKD
jgi:membrane-associated protein